MKCRIEYQDAATGGYGWYIREGSYPSHEEAMRAVIDLIALDGPWGNRAYRVAPIQVTKQMHTELMRLTERLKNSGVDVALWFGDEGEEAVLFEETEEVAAAVRGGPVRRGALSGRSISEAVQKLLARDHEEAAQERESVATQARERAADAQQRAVAQKREGERVAALEAQQRAATAEAQQRAAALEAQQRAAAEALQREMVALARDRVEKQERERTAALEAAQRGAALERERAAALDRERATAQAQERAAALERERVAMLSRERAAAVEAEQWAMQAREHAAALEAQQRAAAQAPERAAAETQRRAAAQARERAAAEAQHRTAAQERERAALMEAQQRAAEQERERVAKRARDRVAAAEAQESLAAHVRARAAATERNGERPLAQNMRPAAARPPIATVPRPSSATRVAPPAKLGRDGELVALAKLLRCGPWREGMKACDLLTPNLLPAGAHGALQELAGTANLNVRVLGNALKRAHDKRVEGIPLKVTRTIDNHGFAIWQVVNAPGETSTTSQGPRNAELIRGALKGMDYGSADANYAISAIGDRIDIDPLPTLLREALRLLALRPKSGSKPPRK